MYRINKPSNSIQKLEKKFLSSSGFHEREHLQEWIAKQPKALGEDLLIIQKEFAGFEGTQERLDLLALDKQGSLVVIENKLDDSGRDVTWQALKYASYCSSLSKTAIVDIYQRYLKVSEPESDAEAKILAFMDGQDFDDITLNEGVSPRIILLAAKFRKEVTSTVLWLRDFKVRLQCFQATLWAMEEELFLHIEQIIPMKDAEDYRIRMVEKAQDNQVKLSDRQRLNKEFWSKLIAAMKNIDSKLYLRISPSLDNWIAAKTGVGGITLRFAVTKDSARAELHIYRTNKDENNLIFEQLYAVKKQIEQAFGPDLKWEKGKKSCSVKAETEGDIYDYARWDAMIDFMTDAMCRLERAMKTPLAEIK